MPDIIQHSEIVLLPVLHSTTQLHSWLPNLQEWNTTTTSVVAVHIFFLLNETFYKQQLHHCWWPAVYMTSCWDWEETTAVVVSTAYS